MHVIGNWWRDAETYATKIHPHYREMFPGGVNEMTALNPDLSAAPLTVKMVFRRRKLS